MTADTSAAAPALLRYRDVDAPQAAVLVLHGGRQQGQEAPPPWNLPGLRMWPFLRSLAAATAGQGVLLGRVRYRCRGWNGPREDAAQDAERALGELVQLAGEVPTVLVGHSMGGRAALRMGGHRGVRGVVALAPWCPEGEPTEQLGGRRVVLLHGERDRTTDPLASRAFVTRARSAGAEAGFVPMAGGDHAMLRGSALWHQLTTRLATGMLGLAPYPPLPEPLES